jgi:hypothetical protein
MHRRSSNKLHPDLHALRSVQKLLTSLARTAAVSCRSSSYFIGLFVSVTVFNHAQYNRRNKTQFHTHYNTWHLKHFTTNTCVLRNPSVHEITPAYTTTILFSVVHFSAYNRMNSEDNRQLSIKLYNEEGGGYERACDVTEEDPLRRGHVICSMTICSLI